MAMRDNPDAKQQVAAEGRLVDELLGPAEERYFGAGYRAVRYALQAPIRSGSGETEALGKVVYPPRWSVDRDGQPRAPHLSSVDAVALPIQLLERSASENALRALSNQRVGSLDLRAGTKPWLRIDTVPVSLTIVDRGPTQHLSALAGNIRARIDLVGGVRGPGPDVLTPTAEPRSTVYGGLFQQVSSQSSIRNFDAASSVLRGLHELEVNENSSADVGVEAA